MHRHLQRQAEPALAFVFRARVVGTLSNMRHPIPYKHVQTMDTRSCLQMERLRFTTPEWLFYEHIVGDTRAPMAKLASRSDQGVPGSGRINTMQDIVDM